MTNFLQIHLLTTYPASNLNRDDTGRPKTVEFGGVQRLRISSQSLKRAWRTSPVFAERLNGHIGSRTQRLGGDLKQYLVKKGMSDEDAIKSARLIAGIFGKLDDASGDKATYIKQLAFVSPDEWSRAMLLADKLLAGEQLSPVANDVLLRVDGAADIAMFGRMLADDPAYNRDAAVQVSHAMTTHGTVTEDDYYVAVDDLKDRLDREDAGTSFIGVQEFGAGVFYTYICVNTNLLTENLAGDREVARDAVSALVECAATVAPGGKQNSFASRARAQYVLLERGSQQPRTLANAFLRSIGANEAGGDPLVASKDRMTSLRDNLDQAYGVCADQRCELYVTAEGVEGSLESLLTFSRQSIA